MALSGLRNTNLKHFLNGYFKQNIESLEAIQGDAGLRSYYRVEHSGRTYVVMDCPVDYCSVQPFIDISKYLRKRGFSAPEIIAHDVEQGLLILEDFGTTSIKNYLHNNNELESQSIYHLVIDLLLSLQKQDIPNDFKLKQFNNELLAKELSVFVDYYIPYSYKRELSDSESKEFMDIWHSILSSQAPMDDSIVLRDYHVENMMYLPDRDSFAKIGLLDFQDALCGSPIYDLVSILEDARISVPRDKALGYIKYFSDQKNVDIESVLLNYHILGAQRNSRILGVFARKAIRDNDITYLSYIKRVKNYLDYNLSHPFLSKLKEWFIQLK